MKLDLSEWKRFSLGRLFDIRKGKRLTAADQEDGDNIYIGAIDSNNGVANHIGQAPIHEGNTISLSYNGSVGEAFYQPEPYWATDDVNALYPKFDGFNKYVGLFFAATIRQEKYRFSYGRKWTLENMRVSDICLPVQHNADGSPVVDSACEWSDEGYVPDWQFMEDYIKSLHHKPLTTKNKAGNVPDLNVAEWKEYRVGDLFDIHPTKALEGVNSDECVGYGVPLVVNQSNNNGVAGFCDMLPSDKGGIITFSDTWEGETFFYQPDDFIGFAHVQGMYPKNKNLSGECLLFIATILEFEARGRYSYGRKKRRDTIMNVNVKLPSDADGNPDWKFMEEYIRALPYGDRLEG